VPEVNPARIAGFFVIGGVALIPIVVVISLVSHLSVGLGLSGGLSILLLVAFGLVGSAACVLAVGGAPPLQARLTRFGLVLLGIGVLLVLAAGIVGGSMEFDPLESIPVLALLFFGAWGTVLGALVTGLSLSRSSGSQRRVGGSILGGLGLAVITVFIVGGGPVSSSQFGPIGPIAAAAAAILFFLGMIGLGVIAINDTRPELAPA
jgi:hypothetical protein